MDWLGAIFIMLSIQITGQKNRWGWVFGAIGGLCFSWVAIEKQVYGLLAFEVINLVLCVRNFIKWGQIKS